MLFLAFCAGHAFAIPPNTPITNTAVASFQIGGQSQTVSASDTITTDASSGNSPPTNITLAPNQVSENAPGAVIGTLTVADADPADTHTFIVADPRFEVVAGQLKLVAGVALDFEATPTVTVNITATDPSGAFVTVPILVVVLNQNEAPTAIALSNTTVAPNSNGATVGQLTVTDPDVGDTHTFTVDDPRFEVVNGTLKLVAGASLPPGSSVPLIVTATDAGGLSHSQSFTITTAGSGPGGASISILEFAPGAAGSVTTDVGQSQCSASANPSGPFQNVAVPTDLAGAPIPVPGSVQLHPTTAFKTGAAFFVQVADSDGNTDASVRDTVLVSLTTDGGDAELLRLLETGPDTGIFAGYIDSAAGVAAPYDCALTGGQQVTLTAAYVDAHNPNNQAQARAAFDPLSRVFLATTGQMINGAKITLVDGTGAPAQVFGDNGTATFPATVVSGTAAVDGGGTNYPVGAGQYRFPTVTSGTYQLHVVPPNRFGFPSAAADSALQALPGAPFALSGASRGAAFNVAATGAAWIDVPLDLLPLVPTTATLGLYALAPGNPNAIAQYVGATECASGAGFVASPPPTSGVGAVAVPGSLVVAPSKVFGGAEPVFIVLTDPDQDHNPFAPDTILLTARSANGDTQVVRLTETGASTGVFSGYLQLSHAVPVSQDCKLSAAPGTQFTLSYQDAFDATDTVSAAAVVDPGSRVFSSTTGTALDGATITLLDSTTGLPAVGKVFADDGVTPFPTTVVSGGSITDSGGGVVSFATGMFRFPVVLPGTYRFQVTPPLSYVFPTQRQDTDLQALPGGPFVLSSGSRGADFTVAAGVPLQIDVPLDPAAVDVFVSKKAGQDTAGIGDFVQYQVLVQNGDTSGTVTNGVLIDQLPKGFRYVNDSTRINGARAPDPSIAKDGVTLHFALPVLPPNSTVEVRYVTEIGAGAALGPSQNAAHVTGLGVGNSNTAYATVTVREDLLASHAIIIGQVIDGDCDEGSTTGLQGVRVLLEDGTYAVTDVSGKYHFEGVTAKTHVVQLDLASIPDTHHVISCNADTRHAGTAFSQFVDVQGGTMWRADFHVAKKPPLSSEVTLRLDAAAVAPRVDYRLTLSGGDIPLGAVTAVVMLPDQLKYAPGSARLDGTDLEDPAGADDGALTFRLGSTQTKFSRALTFAATAVPNMNGPPRAIVKALAMFDVNGKRLRTPVVTSDVALAAPSVAEAGAIAVAPADHSGANVTVVEVTANRQITARRPIVIPDLSDAKTPAFDAAWLAQQTAEPAIVWPTDTSNPRIPASWIVVKHLPDQRVALTVDGRPVEALSFDGTETNVARGVAVTRFRNVPIEEGNNEIIATLIGPSGETKLEASVHYSGAPVHAELVPERSYLIADGITPPVVAVRMLDRSGHALHPGMTGSFVVNPPYKQLAPEHALGQTVSQAPAHNTYMVRDDGLAYIELEPTNDAGRAQFEFKFDGYRAETIDARLLPSARDWVLVGFGEGTLGYNKISGNMEAAPDDDGINVDGRTAFYAKGRVRGEWLLTLAYDSDKKEQNTLGQQIDPNKYYTLYGDGTQQHYDAQTQHKIYVKLERSDFVALFGDFNTGLTRTELTRYSRRMDGARAEYDSGHVDIAAFAANSDQGFVRDQFQGDGTSGEYGLSHTSIVMNSESIIIEVRDRFKTEVVLSQQTLTRYLDYTIDYDNGTLIFKHPVPSQDGSFNLVYIVVEYEVAAAGAADKLVAGGRAGIRFGSGDSGAGVTHIHDGSAGTGGDLTGADFKWEVTPSNVVTMEVARTDKDASGSSNAYLAQIEHHSGDLAGRAYVREEQENFGLGQQSTTEAGTRKFGAEGEYRINDDWRARLDVFQQTNLVADKDRQVAESLLSYMHNGLQLDGGFRAIREETVVGDQRDANELTLGATKTMDGGRLKLSSAAELQLDDTTKNVDYPTRVLTGAEYKLGGGVSLIADQEVTYGDLRDTQNTRVGFKATPWTNGDVLAAIGRQEGENGDRLFATTGLLQTWQYDENWRFDFGLDRVQTLSRDPQSQDPNALSYNPNVPPASGSVDDDFTAAYIGAGYTEQDWSATSRFEYHHGTVADKINVLAGVSRQLDDGKVVSGSFALRNQQLSDGSENDMSDLRFGAAWRPDDSDWAFLNRLDLAFQQQTDTTFDSRTRKLIENMNANYAPGDRWQLALQLGLKYVLDQIQGSDYFGVTSLTGAEYRYNLSARWDLGARGSALHSFETGTTSYSFGPSVGYNPYKNLWMSVGWNVTGFKDSDFAGADYTEQGPYLKVRFKVDQESISEYLGYASFGKETTPVAASVH